METQEHTTVIPVQQVPPTAVMQQAGVAQRQSVNVSAVRVLGQSWNQCFRMIFWKKI